MKMKVCSIYVNIFIIFTLYTTSTSKGSLPNKKTFISGTRQNYIWPPLPWIWNAICRICIKVLSVILTISVFIWSPIPGYLRVQLHYCRICCKLCSTLPLQLRISIARLIFIPKEMFYMPNFAVDKAFLKH